MIIIKAEGRKRGSCSLIQIELPNHILKKVKREEYNKQRKYFFILTCAHNVDDSIYIDQELVGNTSLANNIAIVFGKK